MVGSRVNLRSQELAIFLFIVFIFLIIVLRFFVVILGPHNDYLLIFIGILYLIIAGLVVNRYWFNK